MSRPSAAARIRDYMRRHQPVSWKEIVAGTGLNKDVVFATLRLLKAAGQLVYSEPTPQTPRRMYSLRPPTPPKSPAALATPTGAAWYADRARRARHVAARDEALRTMNRHQTNPSNREPMKDPTISLGGVVTTQSEQEIA